MVEETKKVDLDGKHQQLLDINKETKNFISEFSITPGILDFEIPYKVAVVTQEDLDVNQESIKFQDTQKSFSGSVKNLEGIGQNYYLAIKSEKPMKGLTFKNKLTEILSPDNGQGNPQQGQGQGFPQGQGQGQGFPQGQGLHPKQGLDPQQGQGQGFPQGQGHPQQGQGQGQGQGHSSQRQGHLQQGHSPHGHPPQGHPQQGHHQKRHHNLKGKDNFIEELQGGNKKLKYILAIFTLIIGCFLMYYFWKTNQIQSLLMKPKTY